MKIISICLIIFSMTLASYVYSGTIYYVDATDGNDGNSGLSPQNAWKTISKVNDQIFSPGESILLKKGQEWREQLNISSSGESGNPITIGSYGTGNNPIINGSNLIHNWELYYGNIWQSTCSTDPHNVWFDGVHGNEESSFEDVNTENDWHWNSNILYIYSASDPDTAFTKPGIEASYRQKSIYCNAKDHIIIEGINTKYGNDYGLYFKDSDYLILENITAIHTGLNGLVLNNCQNCIIKNSTFSYNLGDGVLLKNGSCDNLLIGLVCSNNGGGKYDQDGIGIGGSPAQCHRNTITNCTIQNNIKNGISLYESDYCVIEESDISENIENGIQLSSSDNTNIIRNYLSKNGDCGLIAFGPDWKGLKVQYNILISHLKAIALTESSNQKNIYIENNVFYLNIYGFWNKNVPSPANQYIRNNIFYLDNSNHIAFSIPFPSMLLVSNFNCFHSTKTNGKIICWSGTDYTINNFNMYKRESGHDANSLCDDPLFTDAENGNFYLLYSSSCIDAGTDVDLIKDYDGNSVPYGCCVDIGAFEFIGIPNILNAEINASPTSGIIPLTINFTGNAIGGLSPYSYSWDFGDAESSNEQNPSHTYNAEGNYTVTLNVTDANSIQASDSLIITATAPSDPLSISASASPISGMVPLNVSFSASANGGVSPYSYNWDFGDGASSSDPNPSHTYNQAGTYNVTLTVTDSGSSQATDSLTIEASSNLTYTLTISSITGSPAPGTGGTTNPDTGRHSYSLRTSVQAKAIPNSGYRFSKWSGDVISSNTYDEEISISMEKDKSISAYFFTKCGDVNGDLSITAADAQWAFDIYLGRIADPTESEKENADVTCDGTTASPNITPADAHAIFEKFIGRNELPCDCSCKSRTASYQAQTSEARDIAVFVDSLLFNESNEIVVPVAVDKPFDIHTFGFDLVYPSDVLEFVAVEVPEEIKDDFMVDANKIADGTIRAGGFRKSFNLIHHPRTLIKLIFRIIEEAKGAISFNITNTVDDIKNASFRNRRFEEKKISYRR